MNNSPRILYLPLVAIALLLSAANAAEEEPSIGDVSAIVLDSDTKRVRMCDGGGNLLIDLDYNNRCLLNRVQVRGHDVIMPETGVCSAIKVAGTWYTTRKVIETPTISFEKGALSIENIVFGGGGIDVQETWTFNVHSDHITWRIDRSYLNEGTLEDTYFPGWDFRDMTTWTGALLGNGGVAWCQFLASPNASYSAHVGPVSFWNKETDACLRIVPKVLSDHQTAVRFSRQPNGVFSFNYSVTRDPLATKHREARYHSGRQDVWAPFSVSRETASVHYKLSALDYDVEYDRGTFTYFNGEAIRTLLNTIARVGVIDTNLLGSNSWRSGYAVLHEQWIAQMGLAIDDPYYFAAVSDALDYYRDHAIGPDGRVKPRWSYTEGDSKPGTYDSLGFYECQWGYLLDSNPDFVINVAEQYDFNGHLEWVRGHKETCERVLDYMLRRDSDGDAIVEMMTESQKEAKGSDWIDIIWASYENAFVNAELYYALKLWAAIEIALGDNDHAAKYSNFADSLKVSFNKTTANGGFWDSENKWYVHWRDKDDSIHGNNLVVPVNFMAIAYGLCDDTARRDAILDRIEHLMQQEKLFFWPLCLYSYEPGEGRASQFPFPKYENGDIFLAWGELGVRAYADYDPNIPIKYIKNVLDRYQQDGLAYQRFLRSSQEGRGNDILANNCSAIVGLYRNIYGIQPKPNRLYLEPHVTAALNGTRLNYRLRDQRYAISLNKHEYAVTVDGCTIRTCKPFGIAATQTDMHYFHNDEKTPSMTITRPNGTPIDVTIQAWEEIGENRRHWSERITGLGATLTHQLTGLSPNTDYELHINGTLAAILKSKAGGNALFKHTVENRAAAVFDLKPKIP